MAQRKQDYDPYSRHANTHTFFHATGDGTRIARLAQVCMPAFPIYTCAMHAHYAFRTCTHFLRTHLHACMHVCNACALCMHAYCTNALCMHAYWSMLLLGRKDSMSHVMRDAVHPTGDWIFMHGCLQTSTIQLSKHSVCVNRGHC